MSAPTAFSDQYILNDIYNPATHTLGTGASGSSAEPTAFPFTALSSLITIATGLKTGLLGVVALNLNSGPAVIEIYDTAGAVTVGTTAATAHIPIPANATPANGAAIVSNVPIPCTSGTLKAAVVTAAGGASLVTTGLSGTFSAA